MRTIILLCLFACATATAQKPLTGAHWCQAGKKPSALAQLTSDSRSDSIDLLHIDLALRLDFDSKTIQNAQADIVCTALVSASTTRFDLLNMSIDTVYWDRPGTISWQYDGQELHLPFPTLLQAGETYQITIKYHGQPVQDASGWGGFYWQGNFAYNLGVGFDADPHNYGRVWFPCFDNFVERFTFVMSVATPPDRPAYGNGTLMADSIDTASGLRIRQWEIMESIPSYLACVAAGPFASYERAYTGEAGPIPLQIAVAPADSNKLNASFIHLPDALACFEHWYGPYRWNKIGYTVVPFNAGAMEHATNIAYMRAAVDGTTDFETLMAHELSHHWWGDLATCATAEDMWLNEGWASFSELLFTEWVYGRDAYLKDLQTLFLDVLRNTHVAEGGYRAVSGVPHAFTYGSTVYDKGALIPHNLRTYLGDSLFRTGLRTALEQYQFDDWSSAGLRDALEEATGENLDHFFDDWVFQPGFSHFSVDSFRVSPLPNTTDLEVRIFVKQKLRGAEHFFQNIPLEFTLVNAGWQKTFRTVEVSGESDTVVLQVPADAWPEWIWVNTRGNLTLARADREQTLHLPIAYSFSQALMNVNVTGISDSVLLRVEHNWAMPDTSGANPSGYAISNRYWTVQGSFQPGFSAIGSIFYDGKGQLDQLDAELFAQTGPAEDQIRLLYRPGPGHPWQEHPNYFKNTLGSPQDRYGLLRIDVLLPGQYTIGKGSPSTDAQAPSDTYNSVLVSPNPVTDRLTVQSEQIIVRANLVSTEGRIVNQWSIGGKNNFELPVQSLPAGLYWLHLMDNTGRTLIHTIVVH